MKIAIITSVSFKSARELVDHLKVNNIDAAVFKPYKDGKEDFRDYDSVFSYGCSAHTLHNHRFNSREAVKKCVDKFSTFAAFKEAGIPHPRHWKYHADIPKDVTDLVMRKDPNGRKAEDMEYWEAHNGKPIPAGFGLYSEWYWHRKELRVTVFDGLAWVYEKVRDENDEHIFTLSKSNVYSNVVTAAFAAAKQLQIDFVSFDVLYNNKKEFCFLEANSGTILTDEVSAAIVEYYLNLEN